MPDVLSGDADSLYNLLHEYIALVTFEQVAAGYGYSHMGINLTFVRNFALTRKLYRSFVFSYLQKVTKMEAKAPGAVMKSHERENMIKRRTEVFVFFSLEVRIFAEFNSSLLAIVFRPLRLKPSLRTLFLQSWNQPATPMMKILRRPIMMATQSWCITSQRRKGAQPSI